MAWLLRRAIAEFLTAHPESDQQPELPLQRRLAPGPRPSR